MYSCVVLPCGLSQLRVKILLIVYIVECTELKLYLHRIDWL